MDGAIERNLGRWQRAFRERRWPGKLLWGQGLRSPVSSSLGEQRSRSYSEEWCLVFVVMFSVWLCVVTRLLYPQTSEERQYLGTLKKEQQRWWAWREVWELSGREQIQEQDRDRKWPGTHKQPWSPERSWEGRCLCHRMWNRGSSHFYWLLNEKVMSEG